MAGLGSRFSKAGYTIPKPLIDVFGYEMIHLVVKNLMPSINIKYQYIFVCQDLHIKQYEIDKKLKSYVSNPIIIGVNSITQGAACTVLAAKHYINNDYPLVIANCDQYINFSLTKFYEFLLDNENDGLIMTMKASGDKWSYINYRNGKMISVVEKKEISSEATTGIYGFRKGHDFVKYAEKMIKSGKTVNNEFYVAPVYTEMINQSKKIETFNIGILEKNMYGLGTPEDLEIFLKNNSLDKLIYI
jgi:NDP-sugar pyrophosphorylase family protein